MRYSSNWRHQRPGVWLAAALVADLLSYPSVHHLSPDAAPWIALDLWLAHRVWKHRGATALAWFRVLQTFGLILLGTMVVLARFQENFHTGATVVTVLLYALSLWSLMAPGLSDYVAAPQAAVRAAVPEGDTSGKSD